jgi:hypothetical protein
MRCNSFCQGVIVVACVGGQSLSDSGYQADWGQSMGKKGALTPIRSFFKLWVYYVTWALSLIEIPGYEYMRL